MQLSVPLRSGILNLRSIFIITLFFLAGFSGSLQAQLSELELIPIPNPSQTIPVFRDYPDDAALIITSSLTGLQFDSNVEIVANLSDPNQGEYRIIIPPFRQSITVNMQGYRQLRFTVPVSEPRQVLFYEISPLEEEENLISNFFSISPITASDANVYVDGQGVDISTAVKLPAGPHQVRIERDGFKTITQQIDVNETDVIYNFQMSQLQLQPVTITTNPSQASIEIDNVLRANDDYQDFLFPGEYFIRISKNGYRTINQSITVVENPSQDPTLNTFNFQLERFAGALNMTVTPTNARVTLNRQPYDASAPITVAPGQYLLEVTANGYRPYSETINIVEGRTEQRTVNLEQIIGTMLFRIQPISAQVSLYDANNQQVRQWAGIQQLTLPIGQYRIYAQAEGYQDYTEAILIQENQTYNANVTMTPISVIEQQEREREAQLERDRQQQAAERERQQKEAAARERRQSVFKYPRMGGMYLHYSTFTPDAAAFESNVTEQLGLGAGFFKYKNYFTTYFDFVYNTYTLDDGVGDDYNFSDEIASYNFAVGLMPTLPIGPFLLGVGAGYDFTQYEAITTRGADSYYYTNDVYYNLSLAFKPKSWAIGFMVDSRTNIDIGLSDVYAPWNQVKFSLIWAYNQ